MRADRKDILRLPRRTFAYSVFPGKRNEAAGKDEGAPLPALLRKHLWLPGGAYPLALYGEGEAPLVYASDKTLYRSSGISADVVTEAFVSVPVRAAWSAEGEAVELLSDGTLTLDITTSTEYRSPRTADGAWPHLLIQQDFTHRPNIGRIRHLYFAMDLRIEHCERRMSDEQYDESLHTAQSPFYFFMRNTNPRSPDYGLSLWVGVPSFDYRYERLSDEEYVQWDIGTATYIYAIPPRSIWGDVSFHDREWHSARLDLLPLIRRGVAAMQAKGQFVHTMPEDLELTGMNFGWEVPGTFDAGLQIRNLSIRIVE